MRGSPHQHAVKFYANDNSLYATVGAFLERSILDGQPTILIATDTHRGKMLDNLRRRNVEVDAAMSTGQLAVVDAAEALAHFMIGDTLDEQAFDVTIGGLIARMLEAHPGGTTLRAYGEMVDVLWKDGRRAAAVRLEVLWNQLAAGHGFSLLCGYAMGHFYKETRQFEEICRQHTHVMPPDEAALDAAV